VAWKSFMNQVHLNLPVEDWPGPPSIDSVPVLVDRRYGTAKRAPYGCRYARELVLAADKAPTEQSTCSRSLITVPDMTGMTRREALALSDEGGGVTIRFVRQPAAAGEEPGTVVAQTPAPLEPIEIGGVVTAVLAERVNTVIVPRVQSTSYDDVTVEQAITRLRALKFRVVVADGAQDPRAPGTVVDQDPRPNEQAAAGSTVTIVITGAYTDGIEVPDVEGIPLAQAKEKLQEAGLGVRARRDVGAPEADDVVYTSDPRPGDIVPPDTVIWLTTDPRSVASADRRLSGN
jgi:beta-lactam-binding protein with PASTA domain